LSVIQVKIPSLNARRDDILPIAQHYLVKFNQKFGKNCVAISAEAERALKQFNWGGDVRELKNVIERAVLLSTGPELNIGDIGIEEGGTPDRVNNRYNGELGFIPPEGVDIIARMESIERQFIEEALRISGGNETQAAQLINLKYSTFRYRMKKLKIK
jgi:DNA-binding NtrC family response regulator